MCCEIRSVILQILTLMRTTNISWISLVVHMGTSQNPDFLNMALKQDPNAVRELASLCDTLSQTLHMELDEKFRTEQAAPSSLEQQPASAPRMRM